MKIVTLFPSLANQPQAAHVPLQRLIALAWPHWVPRSVMGEIKQAIEDYFQDGYQSWDQLQEQPDV